ncbi:MAG TPA: alanine--glyoxylate aminotransferase family protein [Anaerolineaceae bacterium]|nr:alanine--glyoxylate aminotransferase family protein [Anaerolineaceae bacterium]
MSDSEIKLMIPGPVSVSPEVLQAISQPVVPHYGDNFIHFYNETLDLLRKVFKTEQDMFLFVGSGTAGIDACVGSCLASGEKIIVGSNGFFGDRLIWIAEGNGLEVIPIKVPLGSVLEADQFQQAVNDHPDAKAILVVHLETSTTIINPIKEIAKIARDNDLLMIVDAVSSVGGIPFEFDGWGLDLAVTSINKCLGAPPGLAPVAISQRAWEVMDRKQGHHHGWYSDLRTWRKYATEWADWHPTPVTMPVNNIAALNVALKQLMDEGIENRYRRYAKLARKLRNGLSEIGMPPMTSDDQLNPVLTAAYGPDGVNTSQIVKYLAIKHKIIISGGLGDLKEKTFRIGHMSPIVTEHDIDLILNALGQFPN